MDETSLLNEQNIDFGEAPGRTRDNPLTVSSLNQGVKIYLEEAFRSVWLVGELSNVTRARSGHWYFSLKDEEAQIRAALFRGHQSNLQTTPTEGMQVLVHARVSLYAPRGDYQIIVDYLEEAGEGAFRREFERLKAKFIKEGLFDSARKRELPKFPQRIGVVTSPTGAAIQDILNVLDRRYPLAEVVIYPATVQGVNAITEIVQRINQASIEKTCDVLIVGRGGGSIEDLWAFNSEQVVRALFECSIPTVSAVGHETDVTLADFVADVRAPTPSVAAEHVSPDRVELLEYLIGIERHLQRQITDITRSYAHQLLHLKKRLRHPSDRLQESQQRLDLTLRLLERWGTQFFLNENERLQRLTLQLQRWARSNIWAQRQQQLDKVQARLTQAIERQILTKEQQVKYSMAQLHSVSPLTIVKRGFSIIRKIEPTSTQVITRAAALKASDLIELEFIDGHCSATINSTNVTQVD
ncbi:MAG: exodeoxyribonuclease VII large subunit [Pseudomonadota bacterium]